MAGNEIQLELPLAIGQQRTQDDAQRRAAFELGGEVLDRQEIGERVLAQIARRARLPQQSPLLEKAQMVFGNRGIETADIAERRRDRRPTTGATSFPRED